MNDNSTRRQSAWRFTFRELILLMLAAAAFLGWGTLLVQRFQRFEPTPFFSYNESWIFDVRRAYEEVGETDFEDLAGSMMNSAGSAVAERTMVFRLSLPPEKKHNFLAALQKKVQERLAARSCQIVGTAAGSGNSDVAILGYRRGPIHGTFQICLMRAGKDEVVMTITMQESRGTPTGFGVMPNLGRIDED